MLAPKILAELWMLAKYSKNTRFSGFFLANKILALFLKFPRVKITRNLIAFSTIAVLKTFLIQKSQKNAHFWTYFLRNTRMVLLAFEPFTREVFYSHILKI